MKKTFIIVFALLVGALGIGFAQAVQDKAAETKSEVPELSAFHDIIYPIWHTAYPEKDYAALRKYVPEINKLAAPIFAANLPGILREKEAKWKEGLAVFKKAVDTYNAAAAGTDDAALLKAAEDLHMRYEMLVRTLAPVLKEMDVFHQALYVFVHTYQPEKAYDKIRGASADLAAKAEAITKAALPKRLEAKTEAFNKAAADLLDAAKTLDAASQAHDHDGMLKGVDTVHAKYQALQALFE